MSSLSRLPIGNPSAVRAAGSSGRASHVIEGATRLEPTGGGNGSPSGAVSRGVAPVAHPTTSATPISPVRIPSLLMALINVLRQIGGMEPARRGLGDSFWGTY